MRAALGRERAQSVDQIISAFLLENRHCSPVDAMTVSPDGKLARVERHPRMMMRQPPPGFQEDTTSRAKPGDTRSGLKELGLDDGALGI
jgi:hypothetical protein